MTLYFPLLTNVEIPPSHTLTSIQATPAKPKQYFSRNFYVIYCNIPKLRQACISRAKVTRPWEPSKGTCPMGHCAVVTLPAAFHPFHRPKARQKGGVPENFLRAPLFGSPRATNNKST